jgi:penicillin-binding protein 1A
MAKKKTTGKKRYLGLFWFMVILIPALVSCLFWSISAGLWGELPSFEELENPKSNLASRVFSSDQKMLGTYYVENRSNVRFDELNPYLVEALIATEDERYHEHSGIDLQGLVRVVVFAGGRGGGSTITQQLAKNLFRTRAHLKGGTVIKKLAEWLLAVRLEKQYTKEEIVALYFNTYDFIYNAVGVESAAHVYFNSSLDSLRLEDAAMLVGMAKNPSLFNPRRFPENAVNRRNTVLHQMVKNDFLSTEEFDSLKILPIELDFQKINHSEGLATHFREYLRGELKRWCASHFKPNGDPYDLYRDGLKVFTTIDSRIQTHAEAAVREHLAEHQKNFDNDQKKNKTAPFRDVDEDEIEGIMLAAMRRSDRYNRGLDQYPEIRQANREYHTFSSERNEINKSIEKLKRLLQRAERLKQEHSEKELTKEIQKLRKRKEDLQPDLDKTWEAYHEVWKPVDDSMQVVFNDTLPMKVFSWEGDIDTVFSPMDSIRYYKGFLQAGMMSMDPITGHIKAWVGGNDHRHFKFDNVKQGARQVGSTFKPFVYALAMQEGWSPCEKVLNVPVTFEKEQWDLPKDWTPKDDSPKKFRNVDVSLKRALANSINPITAFIMKKFGPQAVINLVRKMGVTANIDPYPAICLGTPSISVYEMVAAHCTFTNGGVYTEPVVITRIEDKNGNVVQEFVPETNEVMSEETAYTMVNLMEGVVKYGTGVRLRYKYKLNSPIAGKTGTTQNHSDGWFMGHTPDLVTGVWVGNEDRSAHFKGMYHGQGASMALPVFGLYMQKVWGDSTIDISQGSFPRPEAKLKVELDCKEYDRKHADIRQGGDGFSEMDEFDNW